MKPILSITVLSCLLLCPVRAEGTPSPLITLQKQAQDMATALQARDTHALHQIDHDVTTETAEWQKQEPATLNHEQKAKLETLYADLAKQASRVHHDAHHQQWDDATAAQKQFAADVQELAALLP
jgi:hypothetical protein